MKSTPIIRITTALSCLLALAAPLVPAVAQLRTLPERNASTKQEVQLSYSRALSFLKGKQNATTGAWGEAEPVAITGLVLASYMADPNRAPNTALTPELEKGYAFLLSHVQPDGGIYEKARANYNTALALVAIALHPQAAEKHREVMLKARRYLISRQMDLDEKGKTDNALDGGIGYGDDKGNHADLSNMQFALQAIKYADTVLGEKGALENEPKLNIAAALAFISKCQNLPESNKQPWVSTDAADRGGFIYGPTETRGPKVTGADGRVAMRSYGSISYAGLLSFIYAGLDESDPRVKAAVTWLSENFTLDQNPGMGAEGQFYYYHTMAKTLTAAKLDELTLKDGKKVDWRTALTGKLLNTQEADGSWANKVAGRWMESDPVLVTSYVLMGLSHVYNDL